jgi:transposase-like protein
MGKIAKEVKAEILGRIKAGELVTRLGEQYGISYQTIYSWLKNTTNRPSQAELNRYRKENKQLKQLVGELTVMLDNLKKRAK